MWIRDRLDDLFVDEDLADCFPAEGRPGILRLRVERDRTEPL
jgi:hypothetical protein